MKLVIYPEVEGERLDQIKGVAAGAVVINAKSAEQAGEEITDADAFFGVITPPLLAKAQRLRWIQAPTASLEHYIFPELATHDATLTNMRGIHSHSIADQVLGYILSFARNLHLYSRQQLEAKWYPVGSGTDASKNPGAQNGMDLATVDLGVATLGIIGLGAIGVQVARRARPFGMRLVAIDVKPDVNREAVDESWDVDRLDWMLAESDFVAICVPHTPQTVGLFDRQRLQRMKSTAYLINVGRGVIVDLAALVAALEAGELAGAALDVFETEPLPADHPLWRMNNVIVTPHVAGRSPGVSKRHLEVLLDNIKRYRRGDPMLNEVVKDRWF